MNLGFEAESPKEFLYLIHRGIQAVIKIHKSIRRPQPLPKLFPRDEILRLFQQENQNLQRLVAEAWACPAIFSQFSCAAIQLKRPEAEKPALAVRIIHEEVSETGTIL